MVFGSTRVIAVVLALAIFVAALLAGCGGGDSTTALTKAEYIKQGDAICERVPKRYEANLAAMAKEKKNRTQKEEEEVPGKAAVPALRKAVDEFNELAPPSGEEEQVEAIIAALEKGADGVEQNPSGEIGGPKSPFVELDKLAGAYGFKVCSGF